jgi:hypothetical protein
MANFDLKETLELIKFLIFEMFLLACFLGTIWRILNKEFRIKKTLKKWRKRRKKTRTISSASFEASHPETRLEVSPPHTMQERLQPHQELRHKQRAVPRSDRSRGERVVN